MNTTLVAEDKVSVVLPPAPPTPDDSTPSGRGTSDPVVHIFVPPAAALPMAAASPIASLFTLLLLAMHMVPLLSRGIWEWS